MKKDPKLAGQIFEIEMDGSLIEVKVVPEGSCYVLNMTDPVSGRELDPEVFTDEPIPEIFTEEDLTQAINIIFADFMAKSQIDPLDDLTSLECAEWERARQFETLGDKRDVSSFFRGVEFIVKDFENTALYDFIGRSDDTLFARYGDIVARIDFRFLKES